MFCLKKDAVIIIFKTTVNIHHHSFHFLKVLIGYVFDFFIEINFNQSIKRYTTRAKLNTYSTTKYLGITDAIILTSIDVKFSLPR